MKYIIVVDPIGQTTFDAAEYDTHAEALQHLPEFAAKYGVGHCSICRKYNRRKKEATSGENHHQQRRF